MTQSTTTPLTQVGTVIVSVTDQDRALEYYVGKLGFEKRLDVPFGVGDRWIEVAPAGAATTIALVTPPPGSPTVTEISFTTTDADAAHAQLKAQGVDVDEEVLRFGDAVPPMFTFRDPDGTQFRVVQRG
jgi:catechol 2,3-dioxygenase-like lactoylglutathione lyase family enzyme